MSGAGANKPRKRAKKSPSPFAGSTPTTKTPARASPRSSGPSSTSLAPAPEYPLQSFLWSARGGSSRWVLLSSILMVVGLYRWATALWGYSGFQKPPMYGDFEAQRHWMEITTHLPITQWYFHDLEWWGLDYPPLTAYHSWLLGKIGSFIDPTWFALHSSRGLESDDLKIYMRATSLLSEYLIYVPSVVVFVRRFALQSAVAPWDAAVSLTAILLQPALILIDHGHFQYNAVMLGFQVASMACLIAGRFSGAAMLFVATLGFKQMALYYAPAIFAYLLGSCFSPRLNIGRFLGIAIATVVAFAVLFLPFILGGLADWYAGSPSDSLTPPPLLSSIPLAKATPIYSVALQLAQSIHRIFPFARGLFEDKVANFWCAAHTFHKLHRYPTELLQKVSLGATLAAILPPCLLMGVFPQTQVLPYGLAATAWGFFLFSFQVHEKSVLLPLLPMTLVLASQRGMSPSIRGWVAWANLLGSWTMYPLLKRDELSVPYFVLTLLWAWLLGVPSLLLSSKKSLTGDQLDIFSKLIHGGSYIAMLAWHILEAFVPPPKGKPDTWVVINVLIGAAGFSLCYLWCVWHCYSSIQSPNRPSSKKTR